MSALQSFPESRRHPRIPVSWPCRLEMGQSIITGTVRDHSDGGLCIEPEVGYVDGRFVADPRLDADDCVCAVYMTPWPQHRWCRVRWAGRSQAHGCRAIGLEFVQ